MRRHALPALAAALLIGAATPSVAQGTDPFLGEIIAVPFNFCPVGWLPAQGQILPIAQYTALFSLIGTYYGGDGTSNFALPNPPRPSQTKVAAGKGPYFPCIAIQGIFPPRP